MKKKPKIKVVLKRAEGLSDMEIQQKWDRVFDLLFSAVSEKNKIK